MDLAKKAEGAAFLRSAGLERLFRDMRAARCRANYHPPGKLDEDAKHSTRRSAKGVAAVDGGC